MVKILMDTRKHLVEICENVFMPIIGVGTWEMRNKETLHRVLDAALSTGYRFIDTAYGYRNERFIGDSLKTLLPKYKLSREDIFITSKVPPSHQGERAKEAVLDSLENLQTSYVDLYLIHFPGSDSVNSNDAAKLQKLRRESWLELEKLHGDGKIRAIGVSNYTVRHLQDLTQYARISPAVDQCEYHPHNVSSDIVDYCRSRGIHFQAYSPLGSAHSGRRLFQEPKVLEMCQKYECTPAQILLSWSIKQRISVLPKTTNVNHVIENYGALNVDLSDDDVATLKNLSNKSRYCWDPTNVA